MAGFNVDINTADLAGHVPVEIATEMWDSMQAPEGDRGSVVLSLSRRVNDMSSATKTKPVTDLLPVAYFRSKRGLVQGTEQKWRNVTMTAEELDVFVAIDIQDLDDADIPIWDNVRPNLLAAAGALIDGAVLYGTQIPDSWATAINATGVAGFATAKGSTTSLAACADLYDAMEGDGNYLAKLEVDGFMATGHIAPISMRGKFRGERDALGHPLFPDYTVDGMQVQFPRNGAIAATPLLIGGQWDELIWSVRKDIEFGVFKEGIIQDAAGNIVYNLMQQRMVALMLTFRLGFALPNTINRINPTEATRSPFTVLVA